MPKYEKGKSGNPAGKPRGAISQSTKLRQAIANDLPEIVEILRQQALAGDVAAARLLLERALPPLRPEVQAEVIPMTGNSLGERTEAVVGATLSGQLSPTCASELVGVLAQQARIAEVSELEQRIADLEAKHAGHP